MGEGIYREWEMKGLAGRGGMVVIIMYLNDGCGCRLFTFFHGKEGIWRVGFPLLRMDTI